MTITGQYYGEIDQPQNENELIWFGWHHWYAEY
jgi:hypothetical protein